MKLSLVQIEQKAICARAEFDEQRAPISLIKFLYLEYYPSNLDTDAHIDFMLERFPIGNCAIASVYLRHLIGDGDVIDGRYNVEDHQFLYVGKLVVDITADQFGGPKVHVGELREPWSLG